MSNYPDIEQIGDVTKIDVNSLPEIDILIGGSPCQGFSVMGKQQNFEDPRSRLFWEYVKILKATKPKYFLLENVKMKQEYSDIITEALGVEPRIINSRLVSGQNRVRAYWTNLDVGEIADKNISFQDILESGYTNRDKSLCLLESENRLCISSADLYRRNKTKSQGNIVFFSKDFDPEKGVRMLTQYEDGTFAASRIFSTNGKYIPFQIHWWMSPITKNHKYQHLHQKHHNQLLAIFLQLQ